MSDFMEDLDRLGYISKKPGIQIYPPQEAVPVAAPPVILKAAPAPVAKPKEEPVSKPIEEVYVDQPDQLDQPVEQLSEPQIAESQQALTSQEPPKPKKAPKLDDGGYWSRKFTLSVATMAFATLLAVGAAVWPAFTPMFDELTNTLMGVLAIYVGGNTATKWVSLRAKKKP